MNTKNTVRRFERRLGLGKVAAKKLSGKPVSPLIKMYAHALADDDGRQKVYQAQKRLAKITGIDFKKIQTIWKRQQRKTKGQSLSPSDVMMDELRGIVVGERRKRQQRKTRGQ